MSDNTTSAHEGTKEDLVITRIVKASKATVFKLWTECEHLRHWWGPKGFPIVSCNVDLRPEGIFHYSMRGSEGTEMWGKFVYKEIAAPVKLVFVVSFSNPQAGITRHPLSETWPLEVINTLTLTDHGDGTLLTLRGEPINANPEERKTFFDNVASMQQGFKGTLDQLDAYLPQ